MTPHDKIKAALEFYGSPYTYQKDIRTEIEELISMENNDE